MFAARAQHVAAVIEPALARGEWVVCDRFTDATYAYQGGGRGADEQVIGALEQIVHADLQPDLTLYLDIDPRVARERIANRDHDRIEREQIAFFDRVRAVYLSRAQRDDRFVVVDAQPPLEQVTASVRESVKQFVRRMR